MAWHWPGAVPQACVARWRVPSSPCRHEGMWCPPVPGSLAAGHSTPQRSRVPSRDPSADRARQAARDHSAERGGLRQGNPRQRDAAVRSTELLRAAVQTTAGRSSFPPREQRSASPGRALMEVQQRLQQYASSRLPARGGSAGQSAAAGQDAAQQQQIQEVQQAAQRPRVPPTGDHYADASAEIADIDSRLQSLQNFLKAAKAGQPAAVPA